MHSYTCACSTENTTIVPQMRHTSKAHSNLRFNSRPTVEHFGENATCKAEENKIFVHNTQQDNILPGEPESALDIGNVPARGITSSRVHIKRGQSKHCSVHSTLGQAIRHRAKIVDK